MLPYLLQSRSFAILTAPFIYVLIIPLSVLDLFVSTYHAVCFPDYGIPKARRRDFIGMDRGRLRYLNALEGLNYVYCSYVNGLLAYIAEIAKPTEQHWCPIRHARKVQNTHHRYSHFLPCGDSPAYRKRIEQVRCDFKDLQDARKRSSGPV